MNLSKNGIGLIIWSKNRAAQLDFLLNSINRYWDDNTEREINVIYKSDNDNYERGYEKCKELNKINYIKEVNLSNQTKDLLSKYKYCMVSTDDSVFIPNTEFWFYETFMNGVDVFSARYGFNTIVQDPFNNTIQPQLTKYNDEGETISWDTRLHHPNSNFGYIFGFDGHIYRTQVLLNLIQDLEFKTINELESYLFNNCRDKINPYIRSFKHSRLVNLPVNNTSGITQTDNNNPLLETNQKFLEGKRFRFDEVEKTKIVGCHQIIQLQMQ
jgi:hypothetical protein